MKTLRILGIAALLTSFMFKIMHWPGANILAIVGFLLATTGTLLPVLSNRALITTEMTLRPLMAVLLYGAGLMHMLTIPGGTTVFYAAVVVTIVFLLSGDVRSRLHGSRGLRA